MVAPLLSEGVTGVGVGVGVNVGVTGVFVGVGVGVGVDGHDVFRESVDPLP